MKSMPLTIQKLAMYLILLLVTFAYNAGVQEKNGFTLFVLFTVGKPQRNMTSFYHTSTEITTTTIKALRPLNQPRTRVSLKAQNDARTMR